MDGFRDKIRGRVRAFPQICKTLRVRRIISPRAPKLPVTGHPLRIRVWLGLETRRLCAADGRRVTRAGSRITQYIYISSYQRSLRSHRGP